MDLRNLQENLSSADRCEERRRLIEREVGFDLSALTIDPTKLGHAEEQNCEQMFGHVPIPVGYAGPLPVTFSSGETAEIHLPIATTEGALVASVNRGCKALRMSGGVKTESVYHGASRSIALRCVTPSIVEGRCTYHASTTLSMTQSEIQKRENEWKSIGEATSSHLKILKYDIDSKDHYLFLTIYADTDEAMGMNMVTVAAEAIGKWLEQNIGQCVTTNVVEGQYTRLKFVTVAANVDSDKKPSKRSHDSGRGYEVTATATVPAEILRSVLKTTPEALLEAAHAKLELGSEIAGAIGHNCHTANIIAAIYIATGQDPAHVVEGSLADTTVTRSSFLVTRNQQRANELTSNDTPDSLNISTRLPALLVGTRGGGTTLPAQSQCLNLLLHPPGPRLHPCRRLAESVGAAVLAGELSLLAALASNHLAKSHATLARTANP